MKTKKFNATTQRSAENFICGRDGALRRSPSPNEASGDGREQTQTPRSTHSFRPSLRCGRGHRSAMSLPFLRT